MKTNTLYSVLILLFIYFAALSGAQAISPVPDGCYPNFATAEGCNALNSLSTGSGNSGLGWYALFGNSTGSFNTGVGAGALTLNNADSNTAVGAGALLLDTIGNLNVAIGTDALVYNSVAFDNNAIGVFALFNNDSSGSGLANYNNAHGREALYSNVDGTENNAFGDAALISNLASYNTAMGDSALESNTTGDGNTAMGNGTLDGCIDGSENVAVGDQAGTGILHGTNIIAIGEFVSGVSSVFGEVNDSCYIGNISGATVDASTAAPVLVDGDGKLGTMAVDANGNRVTLSGVPGANPPQAVPHREPLVSKKQAMLERKVEELQATVTRQQKQIEFLAAGLQKVSAKLELSNAAPQTVLNE
jgi:hypothetical protein